MSKALNMRYGGIAAVMIAAILIVLAFATIAHANPFYVGTKARTATATSTLAYMAPGAATTTIVYDSYEQFGTNQANSGNQTIPNTVALGIQGIGSSTASVISVTCEFSDDNIDWYQNELFPATTSVPQLLTFPNSFTFTNASSTIGGLTVANGYKKLLECPVPLRYVRAIISDTGASAAVWATFIPTKQRN